MDESSALLSWSESSPMSSSTQSPEWLPELMSLVLDSNAVLTARGVAALQKVLINEARTRLQKVAEECVAREGNDVEALYVLHGVDAFSRKRTVRLCSASDAAFVAKMDFECVKSRHIHAVARRQILEKAGDLTVFLADMHLIKRDPHMATAWSNIDSSSVVPESIRMLKQAEYRMAETYNIKTSLINQQLLDQYMDERAVEPRAGPSSAAAMPKPASKLRMRTADEKLAARKKGKSIADAIRSGPRIILAMKVKGSVTRRSELIEQKRNQRVALAMQHVKEMDEEEEFSPSASYLDMEKDSLERTDIAKVEAADDPCTSKAFGMSNEKIHGKSDDQFLITEDISTAKGKRPNTSRNLLEAFSDTCHESDTAKPPENETSSVVVSRLSLSRRSLFSKANKQDPISKNAANSQAQKSAAEDADQRQHDSVDGPKLQKDADDQPLKSNKVGSLIGPRARKGARMKLFDQNDDRKASASQAKVRQLSDVTQESRPETDVNVPSQTRTRMKETKIVTKKRLDEVSNDNVRMLPQRSRKKDSQGNESTSSEAQNARTFEASFDANDKFVASLKKKTLATSTPLVRMNSESSSGLPKKAFGTQKVIGCDFDDAEDDFISCAQPVFASNDEKDSSLAKEDVVVEDDSLIRMIKETEGKSEDSFILESPKKVVAKKKLVLDNEEADLFDDDEPSLARDDGDKDLFDSDEEEKPMSSRRKLATKRPAAPPSTTTTTSDSVVPGTPESLLLPPINTSTRLGRLRADARQKKQEEAEHAAWTNLRLKEKDQLRTKGKEKVEMIKQWIVVSASQPKAQQQEEDGGDGEESLQNLSQVLKDGSKDATPKPSVFRVPGKKFVAPTGPVEPVVLTPKKRKRGQKSGPLGGHKVQASLTQLNYANPITRTKTSAASSSKMSAPPNVKPIMPAWGNRGRKRKAPPKGNQPSITCFLEKVPKK